MIKYKYDGTFLYIYGEDKIYAREIIKHKTEFSKNRTDKNVTPYVFDIIKEILKSDFKPFYGSIRKNGTITKNYPKKNVLANLPYGQKYQIYFFPTKTKISINKLEFIKELRICSNNLGLKEAKDIVDAIDERRSFSAILSRQDIDTIRTNYILRPFFKVKHVKTI